MASGMPWVITMKTVLKRIVENVGTVEEPIYQETGQHQLWFICPGCGSAHAPNVALAPGQKAPVWSWDGNLEAPTLSPSILVTHSYEKDGVTHKHVCHSFLKAGVMEFLSDCTHDGANKQLPLGGVPEWLL